MKMIRRLLVVGLMAVTLMVPMAVPVRADETDYWAIIAHLQAVIADLEQQLRDAGGTSQTPQTPMVRVVNPSSIVVLPGEVLEANITVRNVGTGVAHGLLTQAGTTGPFTVEFISNSNTISTLNQNSQRQMTLRITVDESAEPGTHVINLNHHFRNNVGTNTSSMDTISVRVGGDEGANVRLSNFSTSVSTVGQGQAFTVTADLQNVGGVAANNVQVSVGNLSESTIFLTSDLGQAFFSTLEAGQTRQVSFTFQTARNISSNVYRLDFRLTYDGSGERATTPFFINVLSDYAHESANIEMRGISAPTGRLNVGQTGNISFELINTGDAAAQNILVTATATDTAALVPSTSNRQTVQNLAVGESRSFTFGFMPTTNSQTQSYTIQLRVEYTVRGAESSSSFVQYVALNVNNPDAQAESTPRPGAPIPRMIVSAYTPNPQIPRAGQNFDLEISFLNTSPTRAISNIRVTLNSAEAVGPTGQVVVGAVFTPVGGSNTLFIGSLDPEAYVTKNITMFTVPDASPRVYTLDVVFDFQDEDYETFNMTERLSIPVAQLSRLEMHPPHPFVPETMDMFGFLEFEFSVINTGRVNLRNAWVRVEGPFDTSQADIFMSTIAAQRTHFYRGLIQPLETGLLEGAIVIYGEDDVGAITELRHEFTVYVMDQMGGGFGFEGGGDFGGERFPGGFPGEGGMFEGGGDRPGFGMWPYDDGDSDGIFSRILAFVQRPIFWGPAAGVIAVAVIAVIVIINRKKTRLSFDDDDAFN